jgi:hypothetical protein
MCATEKFQQELTTFLFIFPKFFMLKSQQQNPFIYKYSCKQRFIGNPMALLWVLQLEKYEHSSR